MREAEAWRVATKVRRRRTWPRTYSTLHPAATSAADKDSGDRNLKGQPLLKAMKLLRIEASVRRRSRRHVVERDDDASSALFEGLRS